jgi:hypothetical protein
LASDPEGVKKTLASAMPDRPAIFSASSIIGRDRYSVEVCSSLPACSRMASTTSGTAWPLIVVRMPPKKSRYRLPAASQTWRPSPRTSSTGSW